jgi:hypothetical protein
MGQTPSIRSKPQERLPLPECPHPFAEDIEDDPNCVQAYDDTANGTPSLLRSILDKPPGLM